MNINGRKTLTHSMKKQFGKLKQKSTMKICEIGKDKSHRKTKEIT